MWNNWMWARLSKPCVSLKRHLFLVACRHPRWRRAGAFPCLRRRRGSASGERQEDGLGEGLRLRPLWGTCEPVRCTLHARGVLQNPRWGLPLEHFYFLFSNFLRFVCECVWSEMVVLLCMVRAAWKIGSVEADTKQNILGFVHTGVKEVTLP